MNRELVKIRCDIDIDISADLLRYRKGHPEQITALCTELGFEEVLNDIPIRRNEQPGLFD